MTVGKNTDGELEPRGKGRSDSEKREEEGNEMKKKNKTRKL